VLEFYKTNETGKTEKIDAPMPGCWISAVAPTSEERDFLIHEIGVLPEFVKSSLDEEESAHIDYDDDADQTLVIFDYPNVNDETRRFSIDRNGEQMSVQYSTMPIGIVVLKGYIVTISLHENQNISDMASGHIKGVDTRLKTRFLLTLLLRISQKYLIYLRQIDRISSRMEKKLYKSAQNKELIEMLGLEKSLVYFSTSLKSDESTLSKIMRGRQIKLYEDDEDLLEDVMIEIKQAIEMCSIYSGILSSTMATFANVISNNMNIVMKILAVITLVVELPNIIFGFYGMNVEGLIEPYAWFPLTLAIVACVIAIIIFKKKDMFY